MPALIVGRISGVGPCRCKNLFMDRFLDATKMFVAVFASNACHYRWRFASGCVAMQRTQKPGEGGFLQMGVLETNQQTAMQHFLVSHANMRSRFIEDWNLCPFYLGNQGSCKKDTKLSPRLISVFAFKSPQAPTLEPLQTHMLHYLVRIVSFCIT